MSETQRNLLMVGSVMLGFGLICIGPFLGWVVTRHEQKMNRAVRPERETRAMRGIGETAEWLRSGTREIRPVPRRLALAPSTTESLIKSPTQVMFASHLSPTPGIPEEREITQEVPLQGPRIDEEPRQAEPHPEETTDLAVVLQEPTAGYSIIDAYVDDAELVLEDEPEPELSPAEVAFWRDPLLSVVYPPEEIEEDGIPMAALAFDILKSGGVLTGVGSDIDVEWEAWNLYEKEAVAA
jgi:hypothetical protein